MSKLDNQDIQKYLKKAGFDPDMDNKLDITLEEIESFGDQGSLKNMGLNIMKYNRMLAERITFINPELTKVIPFTRENLYLICAFTGNGKSTISANISYPLWKQGKKILVISNEESEQDILFRISCLECGYNFNDYKKGAMPLDTQREVCKKFQDIAKYVKVLDVNHKEGFTTKLEGIKNALTAVQTSDFSCVLIDYYQLIRYSVHDPGRSTYDVLNDLRIWFGQYIKNSNVPIVVFAQLHSIGKRTNKELDSRIKDSPGIMEPSTVIIEVVPNFELKTSTFIIHKDRFGLSGKRMVCKFDNGHYVNISEHELELLKNSQKRIKGEKELENLQGLLNEDSVHGENSDE